LGKYLTVIIDPQGYNGRSRDKLTKAEDERPGAGDQPTIESISEDLGRHAKFVSAGDKFNKLLGEHQEEIEQWYLENHPTFRQAQSR